MAKLVQSTAAIDDAPLTLRQMKQGISRLAARLAEVDALDPSTIRDQFDNPEITRLQASIQDALMRTFGAATHAYRRYQSAASFSTGPVLMNGNLSVAKIQEAVAKSQRRSIALLEQAIDSLREQVAEAEVAQHDGGSGPSEGDDRELSRRVFVVHGHDEGARETVARFLERLGFEPIVLHERASRGMTVIEKIEAHSDVGFAVVLMTADDVGRSAQDGNEALEPRARQNVLLELGYFLGRLGRDQVCALKRGEVEIPSDFAGVVWHPMDEGTGWKQSLGRELEAAGHEIDWNKVMRQ